MSTSFKPKLGAPEIIDELEGFDDLVDEPIDLESRKFRRQHRIADRIARMRDDEVTRADAIGKKDETARAK